MTELAHPLIRYHGGKYRLAHWIIAQMPNHTCYTEVFGGAAGVLLQKPRAYAEVYNDLDGDIVNLFKVLRDADLRNELIEQLVLTPYAREEFMNAWSVATTEVEKARRTIIRAQMGFGSAGATKGITGFRIDTKRQYGTAQSLWVDYPEHLSFIGQRLSGVLIENRPAVQVLKDHDAISTLHYVDPPYVHDTRYSGAKSGRIYRHEMDDKDHLDLLNTLLELEGMVMLSGYPSNLYDDTLNGWKRVDTKARISSGRGTDTRTECLWINPAAQHNDLFGAIA
ncbi:DNA adenine methylase [Acinetobacter bereziniae]|uniref:DNA adenine methylase n=1 Tax=Acinetobacter bereziniae TaxID=106648 RepID=UPI0018FF6B8D|nr:DNA adenine methylase [Acinetobacter bereziniae]MBJ9902032.1 DNA adenine methylase [Acinetobacter bereziniae]MCU4317945.1 DNA adenine methylase [Acinetobacter bereziniae]MCU4597758.1 DNA adenine methylase [Acinetobacter bereziniae]